MSLWIPCHTNAKVLAMFLPYVLDQVYSIAEFLIAVLLFWVMVFLRPGRVAAQCKDVPHPQRLCFFQCFINKASRHVGTGEMQACCQAKLSLAYFRKLKRLGGCRAPSSPCDAHKQRTKGLFHACEPGLEV